VTGRFPGALKFVGYGGVVANAQAGNLVLPGAGELGRVPGREIIPMV
jgi:hypothetical protein